MSHSSLPLDPFGDPRADPLGYYARLGVGPDSDVETIAAAYRRGARVVHPDVPVTGDAAAFVALKQAYDVLIHPDLRAAYDRVTRRGPPRESDDDPIEINPMAAADMAAPPTRHPRLRDLPAAVWAGMAVLLLVGLIESVWHLGFSPGAASLAGAGARTAIPPLARDVPSPGWGDSAPPAFGAAPIRLAGVPNYYVLPAANAATLWRLDDRRHGLAPWGQLPAFSAVQGLRLNRQNGMVEVKVTESANGFVDAARLTPGDAAAAAGAWCTFHAGLSPINGEVLTHGGTGTGRISIENRSGQPAVVKLRTDDGTVAASVFLSPGGQAPVDALPDGRFRVEFATGEVWSRACHGFTAGMRAQVLAEPMAAGMETRIVVPPESGIEPAELADQAFERE